MVLVSKYRYNQYQLDHARYRVYSFLSAYGVVLGDIYTRLLIELKVKIWEGGYARAILSFRPILLSGNFPICFCPVFSPEYSFIYPQPSMENYYMCGLSWSRWEQVGSLLACQKQALSKARLNLSTHHNLLSNLGIKPRSETTDSPSTVSSMSLPGRQLTIPIRRVGM